MQGSLASVAMVHFIREEIRHTPGGFPGCCSVTAATSTSYRTKCREELKISTRSGRTAGPHIQTRDGRKNLLCKPHKTRSLHDV
eukprot:1161112-Pelagomonas_calceolata.AAC.9